MASSIGWMAGARCRDLEPELFFPTDGGGVIRAKRVCAACDVADDCLEYALEHMLDHGVWGGTSERERRRMLRVRGAVRPASDRWRLTLG